eukprot:4683908-Lingulodinium_polyedra.AAC.1
MFGKSFGLAVRRPSNMFSTFSRALVPSAGTALYRRTAPPPARRSEYERSGRPQVQHRTQA